MNGSSSSGYDSKGKGKENDFLMLDMGGPTSNSNANGIRNQEGGFQQMQLVEQEVSLTPILALLSTVLTI